MGTPSPLSLQQRRGRQGPLPAPWHNRPVLTHTRGHFRSPWSSSNASLSPTGTHSTPHTHTEFLQSQQKETPHPHSLKQNHKPLHQAKSKLPREESEPSRAPTHVPAARRWLAPTYARHPVGVQQKLDVAAALGPLVGVVAGVLAAPVPVVAGHCERQSTGRHPGPQPLSSPSGIPKWEHKAGLEKPHPYPQRDPSRPDNF